MIKVMEWPKMYIAGPMKGKPDLNRPAFVDGESWVFSGYCLPINPHRIHDKCSHKTPNEYAACDIKALMDCQAIYMLRGWIWSKGARREWLIAKWYKIKVFYQKRGRK